MAGTTKQLKQKSGTLYAVLAVAIVVLLPVFFFLFSTSHSHGPEIKASNYITQIETACLSYWTEYGTMPETAENGRLQKILAGDNSRKIQFLSLKPRDLNAKGEMIDPWGTPFRIAYGSESTVHVVSAGPDRTFGTPDDIGK